jgi:hypothetical protein
MKSEVLFQVRGAQAPVLPEGGDDQPCITTRGDQLVANSLPLNAQLVASGQSFVASTTTAAAPVIAIPTTAALLGLWNGEPDNGKCYVIDSFFAVIVAATAAVQAMSILANVSVQRVDTALANTITPKGLRANRPYNGQGRVAVGITLDAVNGVAANWFAWGPSPTPANTTQVGQCIDIPVNGSIILPPKGQLALSVLSGAATASSVQIGVRWHEVQMPL